MIADMTTAASPTRPERIRQVGPRLMSSVRFRLTLTVALVVALALAGGGVLLANSVEATLISDVQQRNRRILESIVTAVEQNPDSVRVYAGSSEMYSELARRTEELSPDDLGFTLNNTFFFLEGTWVEQASIPAAAVTRDGRIMLFGRPEPDERMGNVSVLQRSVTLPDGTVGTLHAVTPLDEVDRTVRALATTLWMTVPLLILGTAAMAWMLTGSALRPVAAITRRVGEISGSSLSGRVPLPEMEDEIHDLAVTMNAMLDRIEQSAQMQRQFVSDASHELRSPVASIRAQIETALLHPDVTDWPRVARTVLAEDDRLEHLIGNLLAMARLDEGRWGARSELDLEEVVLAQARRVQIPGDPVRLDLSGVLAGRVVGNEGELTSVVRNLVDNAMRHARSVVRVTLQESDGLVTLVVADDGPGVPAGERERIFERFARLQEGRSRDAGGSGLGLALSHRVVHAHGGRIGVAEAEGLGGAAFIVQLPAAG